jgi:uncharacterized membrane protein
MSLSNYYKQTIEKEKMNDLFIKGWVAADAARGRVMNNLSDRRESGDIVQVIIIIAMFVLVCMVVGGVITTAIKGQGNKVAKCIGESNKGTCTDFK